MIFSVKCCTVSPFSKFMLREFETRRPQFDQLTQSAEGILSQTGNSAEDSKDLVEVQAELGSISQQWEDLTQRLSQRSNHIDQAQGTSERFQVSQVHQVPVDPSNFSCLCPAFKCLCFAIQDNNSVHLVCLSCVTYCPQAEFEVQLVSVKKTKKTCDWTFVFAHNYIRTRDLIIRSGFAFFYAKGKRKLINT